MYTYQKCPGCFSPKSELILGDIQKLDGLNVIFKCRISRTDCRTDSYIVFTLKMESVLKNTIFRLKMTVKSGLEKFNSKSLHVGRWLFLLLNLSFWTLL